MDNPVSTPVGYRPASPAAAFDGSNFLVVWTDDRNNPAALIETNGFVIATGTRRQTAPDIIMAATNYWVAWNERGPFGVAAVPVTFDGVVRAEALTPIINLSSESGFPSEPGAPTLTSGLNQFLAVWTEIRSGPFSIRAARVDEATRTPHPPVLLTRGPNSQKMSQAAFNGTNFFVVWVDNRNPASEPDIYGARVTVDGRSLDPAGIVICSAPRAQSSPHLAQSELGYFVVWQDGRGGLNYSDDIYGSRVSFDGTVLDPAGIAISTAAGEQATPHLAMDGPNYLAVWSDRRNNHNDIYAARIGRDGRVLEPQGIPVCTRSGLQLGPSLAYDGTNYLATWHDLSLEAVFGARISPVGQVFEPNGFLIAAPASTPAVSFAGDRYLMAWIDWRHSQGCTC